MQAELKKQREQEISDLKAKLSEACEAAAKASRGAHVMRMTCTPPTLPLFSFLSSCATCVCACVCIVVCTHTMNMSPCLCVCVCGQTN
jgi:hypothetical protein